MSDSDTFDIFFAREFPPDMRLHGTGKFRTPRTVHDKVPIIVFSEGTVVSTQSYNDKDTFNMSVTPEEVNPILLWIRQCCPGKDVNFMHGDEATGYSVRVRLPAHAAGIATGAVVRCAVETPLLWENAQGCGLTLVLIEHVVRRAAQCLIQAFDDEEDVDTPPSYVPFHA